MDYREYGEAAYFERMYEQHQRDEQRELLARVTTEADDAEALRNCAVMAVEAQGRADAGTYHAKCIAGEAVFYYPYPKALIPGHIYSQAGMDEFKISTACEFHFDEWFSDDEEEDYGNLPQDSDAIQA